MVILKPVYQLAAKMLIILPSISLYVQACMKLSSECREAWLYISRLGHFQLLRTQKQPLVNFWLCNFETLSKVMLGHPKHPVLGAWHCQEYSDLTVLISTVASSSQYHRHGWEDNTEFNHERNEYLNAVADTLSLPAGKDQPRMQHETEHILCLMIQSPTSEEKHLCLTMTGGSLPSV